MSLRRFIFCASVVLTDQYYRAEGAVWSKKISRFGGVRVRTLFRSFGGDGTKCATRKPLPCKGESFGSNSAPLSILPKQNAHGACRTLRRRSQFSRHKKQQFKTLFEVAFIVGAIIPFNVMSDSHSSRFLQFVYRHVRFFDFSHVRVAFRLARVVCLAE